MDGTSISWLQGLFNALTALGPVGLLLIAVWGKLKEQQKSVADGVIAEFAKQLVSKQELAVLEKRLQSVEDTQREFGVIKVKLENVENQVEDLKQDVKETGNRISSEISGAMDRVTRQIQDNKQSIMDVVEAKMGRRP